MPNTDGPRLLMLTSGLMHSGLPMRFTIQHLQLEGKISSLHLSYLPSQRSCQTSVTFNLLDVQCLSLTTTCNQERSYPSGRFGHVWESTLGCQPNMQEVWHWFSTSRLDMFHLNSMSPLIQSFKQSEALWETCHHLQNGRRCVDSLPHQSTRNKSPSKMIKVSFCNQERHSHS